MISCRRMMLEQERETKKSEARNPTARKPDTKGEGTYLVAMSGLYDVDQVWADDEGEICVFFFDEEMTLASRMTKGVSRKTLERRRRLEQKLMMKSSE